jgi:hypothetical protein
MLSSEELRSLISTRGVDTGESIIAKEKREKLFVQHVKKNSPSRLSKKNRSKTPGGRTLLQSYLDHGLDANPADTAFTILQKSLAGAGKRAGNNRAKAQQQMHSQQPFSLPSPLSPLTHGLAGISVLKSLAPSVAGAMYHSSFTLLDQDQDGLLRPGDVSKSLLQLSIPFVEEAEFLDGYALAAVRSGAAEGLDFPSFVRICRRDTSLRLTNMASWLSQNGPKQALAAAASLSLEQQSILESEAKASEARRNIRLKNKILREFTPDLTESEEAALFAIERKNYEPPPKFAIPLELNDYRGISGMFFQSTIMDKSAKKIPSLSASASSAAAVKNMSSEELSINGSSSLSSLSSSPKFRAETPIPLPPLSAHTNSDRAGTALSQTEDDTEIEALLLKPWSQLQNNSTLPFVYGPAPTPPQTHFSRRSPISPLSTRKQQPPPSIMSNSSDKNERRRKFDVELSYEETETRSSSDKTTKTSARRRRRKSRSRSPETSLRLDLQRNTPPFVEKSNIESQREEKSEDKSEDEETERPLSQPVVHPVVIHSLSNTDEVVVNPHLSSFSGPTFTMDSFRASSVGFGSQSLLVGMDEQMQQRPSSLPSPTQPGGSFSDFSEKKFGAKNARLAHSLLHGLPPISRDIQEMLRKDRGRSESPPSALKRTSRDGTPRNSRSNSRLRVGFHVDSEGRPSTIEQQYSMRSSVTLLDSSEESRVIDSKSDSATATEGAVSISEDTSSLSSSSLLALKAVDIEPSPEFSLTSLTLPSIKPGSLSWNFEDVQQQKQQQKEEEVPVNDVPFSIPSAITAVTSEKPPKYDLKIFGRYEGAKRISKVLRKIVRRRLRPIFNMWVDMIIAMMRKEYIAAAIKIQAIARGFLARTVILPQTIRRQSEEEHYI